MNELRIDDLVDQLNAVLVRHGWCIAPIGTPVPDTRPESEKPRPDAGSDAFTPVPDAHPNPRPEHPKDYAEEGSTNADLERKRNRLAALLKRGKV